jgi:hypothetical protein
VSEHPWHTTEASPGQGPERRLWLAVLMRAVLDARGHGGPSELLPARSWLILDDHARDRELVCELAEVSEDRVRDKAREYCKTYPPTRLFPDHDFSKRTSEKRRGRRPKLAAGVLEHLPRQGHKRTES